MVKKKKNIKIKFILEIKEHSHCKIPCAMTEWLLLLNFLFNIIPLSDK